jgi:hypothetical protein
MRQAAAPAYGGILGDFFAVQFYRVDHSRHPRDDYAA